ncbi:MULTISPECIES: hypothetical protein [Streptosporangium]|uniref:Helix-turn-helix domain-containing protein n=1 Tax=Streptosporangium brasiliense TaxID=47480 RepID=A0ABT9RMD2_9ACTN|nr:hypothetical protein [Streptosporangium brasiliense]MDP9870452.1 hypothetical protein [Streptosporangium brasiliense]
MANEIESEVWHKAPREIKGVELLVLLRLANSAGYDHRMTWLGVDALAKQVRASRSAVYGALAKLADRGVIQEVAQTEWPAAADGYMSVVRRITPVEFWDENCPAPEYRTPVGGGEIPTSPESGPVGEEAAQSSDPEAGEIRTSPESGPNRKITTYRSTSYSYSAAPSARRNGKTTKAEAARKADAADAELDPARFLFTDDELPEGARRDKPARQLREPGPDTGMGLATYFAKAVVDLGRAESGGGGVSRLLFTDVANRTKLAATLNRWKNQGISPDEIRRMVDAYVSVAGFRNPRAIPWVDFLAKRALLAAHAAGAAAVDAGRPETFNPAAWTSQEPHSASDGTYDFNPDDWSSQ